MPPPEDLVQASYDRLAEAYANHLFHELAEKPLDRALLDAFADQVRGRGLVGDLGCGPGQTTRYLHERGVSVVGIDVSAAMIRVAERLSPGVAFHQGTMLALDADDGAWGGAVAFYSIVHFAPDDLPRVFRELARVLAPGGLALLGFHRSSEQERVHVDELWGTPVSLDFQFHDRETVERHLAAAGLLVQARIEREPYPGVEHPSQRAYVFARRTG